MASIFGQDLDALLETGDEVLRLLRNKMSDAASGTTLISKSDLNKLYIEFSAQKALIAELAKRAPRQQANPDR